MFGRCRSSVLTSWHHILKSYRIITLYVKCTSPSFAFYNAMSSRESAPRASIITPIGEGGIGIIAVTGHGSARLLDDIFAGTKRSAADIPPGRIAHGVIRRDERDVDEVIVACLRTEQGPGTPYYEINCHGGVVAVRAVLDCLKEAGARITDELPAAPIEPAEAFSESCPLSPDAIRGNALRLLSNAMTRLGASMLLHQADGAFHNSIGDVRNALENGHGEQAGRMLDELLATAPLGRALTHPRRVAIAGPPNAGKSTLLNAFLKKDRVVVHERPGTTRDVVAEVVSVRGVPFELMDTAGIRTPEGEIEADAIDRARRLVGQAETVLLVYDVRQGLDHALEEVSVPQDTDRILLLCNKIDLVEGSPTLESPPEYLTGSPHIAISAKQGTHMEELESALLAPYANAIERCKQGSAVIFNDPILNAIRDIARRLEEKGADEACRRLKEFTGAR